MPNPLKKISATEPGLMLAVEVVEGAPHAVAGQILADLDVKAVALEFVGDVARVVDRLLERRFGVGIFGVADDQRKPVGRPSAATDRAERRNRQNQSHKQSEANSHVDGGPANKAPIPACAAATLLYANCIIKPGLQAVNCLRDRRYRDN